MNGLLSRPSTPESSVLNARSERTERVRLKLLTILLQVVACFLRNNLNNNSEESIFIELSLSTYLKIFSLIFLF